MLVFSGQMYARFRNDLTKSSSNSWQKLLDETGVGTEDVRRRIVDFGLQGYFTSHHPVLVPEPFTLEPCESFSRADLDEYATALGHIAEEAREDPDLVKTAPHNAAVHKIAAGWIDDPAKLAMTWRGYQKKHGKAAVKTTA